MASRSPVCPPAESLATPSSNSRADIGTYRDVPSGMSASLPTGTWTRVNSSGLLSAGLLSDSRSVACGMAGSSARLNVGAMHRHPINAATMHRQRMRFSPIPG